MENVRISIPGMKSLHCQMTVGNAIRNLGAIVNHIEPTVVDIDVTEGLTKTAIIRAIENAGYKVAKS